MNCTKDITLRPGFSPVFVAILFGFVSSFFVPLAVMGKTGPLL